MTVSGGTLAGRDLLFGHAGLAVRRELAVLGVAVGGGLAWTGPVSGVSSGAGRRLVALGEVAGQLDAGGGAAFCRARVRSVMECASLSWMGAGRAAFGLLGSIRRSSLRIVGATEEEAGSGLSVSSLRGGSRVAVAGLYGMHAASCPPGPRALLPQPCVIRRAARSGLSVPCRAPTEKYKSHFVQYTLSIIYSNHYHLKVITSNIVFKLMIILIYTWRVSLKCTFY